MIEKRSIRRGLEQPMGTHKNSHGSAKIGIPVPLFQSSLLNRKGYVEKKPVTPIRIYAHIGILGTLERFGTARMRSHA